MRILEQHQRIRRALHVYLMEWLRRIAGFNLVGVYRAPAQKPLRTPPHNLRVELARPADLRPYAASAQHQLSTVQVNEAFARGDACVASYVDGELAAYGWVAYQNAPHVDGLWVSFGPGQRYNYKSYTLPAYRGRHLRGSYGVLQPLDAQHGVTHTISFIATHNFASRRAERRNNGKRVGFAGYFTLFGRTVTFRSPGAARYGFTFTLCADAPAAESNP